MLMQFAGACRFFFNAALEQRRDYGQKAKLSYYDQQAEIPSCRAAFDWLRACPSQALQAALLDLDKAYQRFFRGLCDYPKPRRKGERDGFRLPNAEGLRFRRLTKRMGAIRIPKVGWIKCRGWHELSGELRTVSVTKRGGYWYATIQCRRQIDDPTPIEHPSVGVDRGVAVFAALSNGTLIEPLNAFKGASARIAKAQRRIARKQKFSANWKKQKAKINRLHIKAADARKDYLHNVSTLIAKSHGIVRIEKLYIQSMSASAVGTLKDPGINVKPKRGLNRSIMDQGWGTFARFLSYKLSERGGQLVEVPAAHTSTTCSKCGARSSENRKSQSAFACCGCGHTENADVNAARNILQARTIAVEPPKRTLRRVGKRKLQEGAGTPT